MSDSVREAGREALIVYPALDLRGGKVVRLQQGDPNRQTVYGDDPAGVAARWLGLGARWLHVVNLDGTFSDANHNEKIVGAICRKATEQGASVQFGGGLRSVADVDRAFALGVARVVLGTVAVQQPELVAGLVRSHGAERISVALDARDGLVTTHGWQQQSAITPVELGKQFAGMGVRHALYTDVSRDGELTGVNVPGTATLARETGLQVVASGGVSSLADVIAVRDTGVIAGVILGKALYEGRIELGAALRAVDQSGG